MATSASLARHKPGNWVARLRPRLLAAILAGIAIGLAAPEPIKPMLRAVIAWDSGIVVYLILILAMAARATPQSMHRRAAVEDATRWVFLTLMAGAAWFSMFALLGVLRDARNTDSRLSVELTLLAGTTILLSWVFAHVAFAVHYAHDFYADLAARRAQGLLFPGGSKEPDYWDFSISRLSSE